MAEQLYMDDSYLKEFDAKVATVNGRSIMLDKTAFYPNSGGQPNDTGKIVSAGKEFKVANVRKAEGDVAHEVDADGLAVGDSVHCIIDWDRRHRLMRMHTAAHLLSAIMNQRAGVLITGNQLGLDASRMDFSLENFDRERIVAYCNEANGLVKKSIPVKTYFLPREEAMRIPGVVRLANVLPPSLTTLRIVEIEGVDKQLDGGTHVANLSEIGEIEITKMENKGKDNRRVYFNIKP